ncbi:MAG: non-homologous end-joining DNA ligase [Sporomusaceae bacterium]|nr:non-homologous end-joining DNA ligase [Sporomusaceae bacterium]
MPNEQLPRYRPMLAKLASKLPPDSDNYGFEIKWDGIRAMSYIEAGKVRFISRNGFDITFRYPELHALPRRLQNQVVIFDGEITAFDAAGRPSFQLLQQRMRLEKPAVIAQSAASIPVTYIIFDLLYSNGQEMTDLPYRQRRSELDKLGLTAGAWTVPPYYTGQAADFLASSRKLELEGIMAKRLDSLYLPGKRNGDWLKIKNIRRQEFVIGGWTAGAGSRAAGIGALLLGYHDRTPELAGTGQPQRLIYAGACGTGFSAGELRRLRQRLQPLTIATNPFASSPPKSAITFVRPQLVAEIAFSEWTAAGTLRHPAFLGLRTDKEADWVIREC